MQAIAVTTAKHQPSGKFVNNDHFAVFYHIVAVEFHERLRPQRLIEIVRQLHVFAGVHIGHAQQFFRLGNARFGREHLLGFFVQRKVGLFFQLFHHFGYFSVDIGSTLARAGNNQRRSRLIDQNAVHFIDNGVIQRTLHHLVRINDHIVTQIVKPEFIVGTISNVAGISMLAVGIGQAVQNRTHGQA